MLLHPTQAAYGALCTHIEKLKQSGSDLPANWDTVPCCGNECLLCICSTNSGLVLGIRDRLRPLVAACSKKLPTGSSVALRPKFQATKPKFISIDCGVKSEEEVQVGGARGTAKMGVRRQAPAHSARDAAIKKSVCELQALPSFYAGVPIGGPPCLGAIARICGISRSKLERPLQKHGGLSMLHKIHKSGRRRRSREALVQSSAHIETRL